MVLEAFAALGLASSIVAFVDFSFKLISHSQEIHQSLSGLSSELENLDVVSQQLLKVTSEVEKSALVGSAAVGSELTELAEQCKDIASSLASALKALKGRAIQSKWQGFVQAMREMGKRKELQDLAAQLERLQNSLQLRLIALLRTDHSEILQRLDSLSAQNEKLQIQTNRKLEQYQKRIFTAIRDLERGGKLHAVTVEQHVASVCNFEPIDPEDVQLLSKSMVKLSQNLALLATDGRSISLQSNFIRTLYFEYITDRRENVALAHEKTFSWILDDKVPDDYTGPTINFLEWLKAENGIFWIHGKPGSGKSTLMKFLYDHPRTVGILSTWAQPRKLTIATYFFWNAGSQLQKTQKGLLQSLLYEILRQRPSLVVELFPDLEDPHYHDSLSKWTFSELRSVFARFKDYSQSEISFCLFIDGLDEYDSETAEGSHEDLIGALKELAQAPHVKLCISSRSWFVFRDAFSKDIQGRDSRWTLALEDINRDDIARFVQSELADDSRFKRLERHDSRYCEVVKEVVDRSKGVFLWVFLVVRNLKNAMFTNQDRFVDVKRLLETIPGSLKSFFRNIIKQVEGYHLEQTAETFKMMLTAPTPIPLIAFSFLDEEETGYAFEPLEAMNERTIMDRQGIMRRRLDGRCKGLVEVVGRSYPRFRPIDRYVGVKVDFLHRTVRDFLLNSEMAWLFQNLSPGFDAHVGLAEANLAQLKAFPLPLPTDPPLSLDRTMEVFNPICESLAYHARELRVQPNYEVVRLLDQAAVIVKQRDFLSSDDWLAYLTCREVLTYLEHKLLEQPKTIESKGAVLLHAALLSPPEYHTNARLKTQIISLLLKKGADPNSLLERNTVWCDFIAGVRSDMANSIRLGDGTFDIVKLMLQHGANPTVVIGQSTDQTQTTATDIIHRCNFTSQQKDELTRLIKEKTSRRNRIMLALRGVMS